MFAVCCNYIYIGSLTISRCTKITLLVSERVSWCLLTTITIQRCKKGKAIYSSLVCHLVLLFTRWGVYTGCSLSTPLQHTHVSYTFRGYPPLKFNSLWQQRKLTVQESLVIVICPTCQPRSCRWIKKPKSHWGRFTTVTCTVTSTEKKKPLGSLMTSDSNCCNYGRLLGVLGGAGVVEKECRRQSLSLTVWQSFVVRLQRIDKYISLFR